MTKIASGAMSALSSLFLLAGVPLSAEAAGAFSQIYAFTGGADGAYPDSAVTFDAAGNMYGQTGGGGNVCADGQSGAFNYGCGTLYRISPTGQLTTLVTFTGANGYGGGGKPAIVNGKLYASTIGGGASNLGVIFSVNTDGTGFQLIHQFSGKDGANPIGPLIPSSDGGLYGIAYYGGYYRSQSGLGNGILFKINRNGSYMPIHEFRGKGGNDGSEPVALLIDGSGTLYGSTLIGGVDCYSQGCGTIFSYVPSTGAFTNLFELSNVHKGASNPYLGSG